MLEKIRKIAEPYGLNVVDVELITKGYLSENFKVVCADGVYFLKQYRSDIDEQRIRDIHASKNFFSEKNIPVVMPLPSVNGDFFILHEGRFFSLFPFVYGNTYPDQRCNMRELESLARTLAHMHHAGEVVPPDLVAKKFVQKNQEQALELSDSLLRAIDEEVLKNGETDFDREARRIILKKRDMLNAWPFSDESGLPDILVHYDLHAGNVFFDESAVVQHVFDFELVQYEPAAFDLVRIMTIVCMDYGSREEKWERVNVFLAAYRSVRAMSDDEFRLGVVEFVKYRATTFWVESQYYLQNNRRVARFLECDENSREMWLEWLDAFGGLGPK